MLGQPRQSLEDARTATTLDPEFAKGWTRVARCCVLLGDTVTARQALTRLGSLGEENQAEQRNIESLEKLVGDSQQAYQAKDYRKSLWCLDKALEIASNSHIIRTSRAECLAFLGRYTEASEAANSVLQFDNMNADAIYVRGLCLYYEDNVDRAFSHFTQVLRFAPDHAKAKEIYKVGAAFDIRASQQFDHNPQDLCGLHCWIDPPSRLNLKVQIILSSGIQLESLLNMSIQRLIAEPSP